MEAMGQSKYPVKFVQTLRGGTAHLILFSDGKKYVVKWNGTEIKRAKEAVNEYVVGKLAMLLSLPNKLIYEVIQSIPEEWEVSKEESEALYHYLIEHKNRLPNVIDNFINKYNNNISNKKEKKKKKKK